VVFRELEFPETDPAKIKNTLETISGVAEVQYSDEWLKQFEGLMNLFRLTGIVIGGLLCIGVLFIMTNTIKLTIYSRKNEIEIQKLVGATDWFVKMPFLLEGVIQGVLSAGVSLLCLYLGYLLFAAKPIHLMGIIVLDFVFLPAQYALSIVMISILLGLIGSLIAVGRFIAADRFIEI
jgi:cell division transport system permease protein